MKQNSFLVALALLGSGIGISSFASADQPTSQVTVCVDWATKQVRYSNSWKGKCPNRMSPLVLSEQGPAGATGPVGPAGATGSPGATGATGSPGAAGSAFNLTQYPVLNQLENQISSATCEKKWGAIIGILGSFNIQETAFGQPIANNQWALDMAGNCPYIYPEIFLEPHISRVSDFVTTGSASGVIANSTQSPYTTPRQWTIAVTSMKVAFTNLRGFAFCKPSDPQYAAFNMTQNNFWSESATAEIQYNGPSLNFYWSKDYAASQIADTARGYLDIGTTVSRIYFCGTDATTPSGLGVRSITLTNYAVGPQWVAVKP